MTRTPTCVWRISPAVIAALDERFGDPVDSYVNGSQTWLREEGAQEMVIEWRVHPVAGYERPAGVDVYDVWRRVVDALHAGESPPAPLGQLWDGLEAFPAYGDEVEPAALAALVTDALGLAPDAFGLVDHRAVGDEWERSQGATSIVSALMAQLTPPT